jgi:hypothetical protein
VPSDTLSFGVHPELTSSSRLEAPLESPVSRVLAEAPDAQYPEWLPELVVRCPESGQRGGPPYEGCSAVRDLEFRLQHGFGQLGSGGIFDGRNLEPVLAVRHPELCSAFADNGETMRPMSAHSSRPSTGSTAEANRVGALRSQRCDGMTRKLPKHVGCDFGSEPDNQTWAAMTLCGAARSRGIAAGVTTRKGDHDWPEAG